MELSGLPVLIVRRFHLKVVFCIYRALCNLPVESGKYALHVQCDTQCSGEFWKACIHEYSEQQHCNRMKAQWLRNMDWDNAYLRWRSSKRKRVFMNKHFRLRAQAQCAHVLYTHRDHAHLKFHGLIFSAVSGATSTNLCSSNRSSSCYSRGLRSQTAKNNHRACASAAQTCAISHFDLAKPL